MDTSAHKHVYLIKGLIQMGHCFKNGNIEQQVASNKSSLLMRI